MTLYQFARMLILTQNLVKTTTVIIACCAPVLVLTLSVVMDLYLTTQSSNCN